MGAEGARRERMQRILVGLLAASLSLLGLPLRAENRTAPKGPDEDGTKPALVRIAGEGLLNSHAFGFLTELSDDIGGRVTGTPAHRRRRDSCPRASQAADRCHGMDGFDAGRRSRRRRG